MYLYFSPIGILFSCFIANCLASPYKPARGAELIVGDEREFCLSLSNITITASAYGVGVVVGYGLLLQSGVETEYPLVSFPVASSPSAIASSWGVTGYFDLRTCTTVQRQFQPFGG